MHKNSGLVEKAVPWVALVVSVASAAFTYVQTAAIQGQLRLSELQVRPYVKYVPQFAQSKRDIVVTMILANLSAVPAHVAYTELMPFIDGTTSGMNMHSVGQEILYSGKDGMAELPIIKGETATKLIAGDAVLQISACVVYGSLSKDDPRRWELRALYEFEPGSPFPKTYLLDESAVPVSQSTCSSRAVREQWIAAGGGSACPEGSPCESLFESPRQTVPAK